MTSRSPADLEEFMSSPEMEAAFNAWLAKRNPAMVDLSEGALEAFPAPIAPVFRDAKHEADTVAAVGEVISRVPPGDIHQAVRDGTHFYCVSCDAAFGKPEPMGCDLCRNVGVLPWQEPESAFANAYTQSPVRRALGG